MPLKKKNKFKKFLIWLLIIAAVFLMFYSFPTTQYLNEVVLIP